MDIVKIIAIGLIAAGALGLTYGGFTYTQTTHEAGLGPIRFSVDENHTVYIPLWASGTAVALGEILLLFGGKLI